MQNDMKRKLAAQMRFEWRSNIWMTVELLVVALVLFVVFAIMLSILSLHATPKGVDYDNLYTGYIGYIGEDAETYQPYDDTHSYATDLDMIVAKLKSNPNVEVVGLGSNMLPYNYNYWGNQIVARIDTSEQRYSGNLRTFNPDVVRAIKLTGINGETTEELAAMIERGDYLVSTKEVFWDENCQPERWRGVDARSWDSTRVMHIGAVINGIRRIDYERCAGVIVRPLTDEPQQIVVRIRPGSDRAFLDSLSGDDLEHGNVFIGYFKSLADLRTEAHRDVAVMIRNTGVCALFVLISVFLGFLGTFWFRTAQRVPELALRKVNGATNGDIFRRCISEGLLLLVIPLLLTAAIAPQVLEYLITSEVTDISGFEYDKSMLWWAVALSAGSMAIMIVAGIAIPARKAMKIEPAQALSEE